MTNNKKLQNIDTQETAIVPTKQMTALLANDRVKGMFENALNENAGAFISSLIDLYNSDSKLQECNPQAVMMEALKAATLNLAINKSLGFAYIIPYKNSKKINNKWIKVTEPQFQIGYKGYIQLAMRTGQYKHLNSGIIFEGMEVRQNYLTGNIEIVGHPVSEKEIGYFCYMKLVNGFEKAVYMNKEECLAHGAQFSKTFGFEKGPWKENTSAMCQKTVTLKLLSKYGILSTEMQQVINDDVDREVQESITLEANQEPLDFPPNVDIETGEILDGVDYEVQEDGNIEGQTTIPGIEKAPF